MPRWAVDVTVLKLNTGVTVITVYRGKPNGKLVYSAFINISINLNLDKFTLKTGFVAQGHILYSIASVL